jgi:hypothetical protein
MSRTGGRRVIGRIPLISDERRAKRWHSRAINSKCSAPSFGSGANAARPRRRSRRRSRPAWSNRACATSRRRRRLAGWRQERASLYKDPTNLHASINRFFDETAAVRGKYGRAGDLAAAVQRPAAQYRGRYQARQAQADQLRGGRGAPGSAVEQLGRRRLIGREHHAPDDDHHPGREQPRRARAAGPAFLGRRAPIRSPSRCGRASCATSRRRRSPTQTTRTRTPGTPRTPSGVTGEPVIGHRQVQDQRPAARAAAAAPDVVREEGRRRLRRDTAGLRTAARTPSSPSTATSPSTTPATRPTSSPSTASPPSGTA